MRNLIPADDRTAVFGLLAIVSFAFAFSYEWFVGRRGAKSERASPSTRPIRGRPTALKGMAILWGALSGFAAALALRQGDWFAVAIFLSIGCVAVALWKARR